MALVYLHSIPVSASVAVLNLRIRVIDTKQKNAVTAKGCSVPSRWLRMLIGQRRGSQR